MKEKKRCPVCGGRIRNGRCRWCGEKEIVEEIPIDESVMSLLEYGEYGMEEEDRRPEEMTGGFWWERRWICITLLIVCFPAGIIHMYAYDHFRAWQKRLIILLLIVIWGGGFLFLSKSSPLSVRYNLPPADAPVPFEEMVPSVPDDLDGLLDILLIDEARSLSSAVKECVKAGWSEDEIRSAISLREVDFRENARRSAEWCVTSLAMSRRACFEQLTSEFGEGFTEEEASWALLNIEADYISNAVKKAEGYRAIGKTRDEAWTMLTGEYGEMFSAEEADEALSTVYGE